VKSYSAALDLILSVDTKDKQFRVVIWTLQFKKLTQKRFYILLSITFGLLSSSGDEGDGLL